MSTEAMKQALEALELMYACYAHPDWISHRRQEEKILAQCVATTMTLRKAIQEEALRNVQRIGQEIEQEPVAWMNATRTNAVFREVETSIPNWSDYYYIPLYTHSQIEQDWSTQEAALESLREHMARIKELEVQIERMKSDKPVAWMDSSGHPKHLRHIQSSEERRLYGKLQPLYLHPQPKQEPVAYIRVSKTGNVMACAKTDDFYALPNGTLLYTHPQPKNEHVY